MPLWERFETRLVFRQVLIFAFNWYLTSHFIQTLLTKRLQPSCLLVQSSAKPFGHLSFGDDFRKFGGLSGASCNPDVRMFAMRVRRLGNDTTTIGWRKCAFGGHRNVLFVEDRFQLRRVVHHLENRVFRLGQCLFDFVVFLAGKIKWPNFDFRDLLWVKNTHCDSVSALICEMTPDSSAEAFLALPHVNRLTKIVVENIHTTGR